MTKKIAKWEKEGFVLQSFEEVLRRNIMRTVFQNRHLKLTD